MVQLGLMRLIKSAATRNEPVPPGVDTVLTRFASIAGCCCPNASSAIS